MIPGPLDHVAALALVVVLPLYARYTHGRMVAEVSRDVPGARLREYRYTLAIQWTLAGAVLVLWLLSGRTLAALGLAVPAGTSTWIGLAATAAVLAFLAYQERRLARMSAAEIAELRGQIEPVRELLPRTPAEVRHFQALCVTAGVCEELLYRGFLVAYAAAYLGTWPGAAAAGIAFGAAHAYQGAAGVLKTGAVGLLTAALYVASGSLLWPMLLHVAIDLQGASIGRRFLAAEETAPSGA